MQPIIIDKNRPIPPSLSLFSRTKEKGKKKNCKNLVKHKKTKDYVKLQGIYQKGVLNFTQYGNENREKINHWINYKKY